jgi:hypothetical protein
MIDLGISLTGRKDPKGVDGGWCVLQVVMVEET